MMNRDFQGPIVFKVTAYLTVAYMYKGCTRILLLSIFKSSRIKVLFAHAIKIQSLLDSNPYVHPRSLK